MTTLSSVKLTTFNQTDILILIDYLKENLIGLPHFWEMMIRTHECISHHENLDCLINKRYPAATPGVKDYLRKGGYTGDGKVLAIVPSKRQLPFYAFDDETEIEETIVGVHCSPYNDCVRLCVDESTRDRLIPKKYFIWAIARFPLFDQIKYSNRDGLYSLSLWQQGKRVVKMVCTLD
jgi:hypothetical protein